MGVNAGQQIWSTERAMTHANEEMSRDRGQSMLSPLALDGWLEFQRARWGVEPLRVRLGEGDSCVPAASTIGATGHVIEPPQAVTPGATCGALLLCLMAGAERFY